MTYNFLTLSFTGEWEHLEPEFIKFHFRESLARIRIAVLIVGFFYAIFGILDAIIVPDKKILDTRRDIPIILCTGYSKNITQQKIKALGIRAFLMKPLTRHSLLTTIRKVLDTGRLVNPV